MPTTKHCCFGVCVSDSRNPSSDPEVKFFQFPKPCRQFRASSISRYRSKKNVRNLPEEQRFLKEHVPNCDLCRACNKWVRLCKRNDRKFSTIVDISKDTYICSLHFPEGTEAVDVHRHLPGVKKKERVTKNSSRLVDKFPKNDDDTQRDSSQRTLLEEGNTSFQMDQEIRLEEELLSSFADYPSNHFTATSPQFSSSANLSVYHEEPQEDNEHGAGLSGCGGLPEGELTSRDASCQAFVMQKRAATQTGCVSLQKTAHVQCELSLSQISKLEREVELLRTTLRSVMTRNYELEGLMKNGRLIPPLEVFEERLKEDDVMCKSETMFTYAQLQGLVQFFTDDQTITMWGGGAHDQGRKILSPIQEIILTLLRLRSGYLIEQLANLFSISEGLISQTVTTWIQLMYVKFKAVGPYLLASRDKIRETLPERYHNMRNLRVIVDGAEFFCESPSDFRYQTNTYSQYKGHTTVKILLGCTPTGSICFISEAFEGSISDRELVIKSGLLEMLDEGDMILADRGFTIKDLTDKKKINLNIPSFLSGREYLTPQEEIKTRIVAKNRIIIEHLVRRVKEFRIFQRVLPLAMRHVISQIVYVCACLSNFQAPCKIGA